MPKKTKWVYVTKEKRCPICEKPDWCMLSPDGGSALCRRVESNRPGKFGGWNHKLKDSKQTEWTKPKAEKKDEPRPDIDWTAKAKEMFRHKQARMMRDRLSKELGVSKRSLIRLYVGWGWDQYRKLEFSTWPERDASGGVTGIMRRYPSGSKKTMKGSKHGVIYEDLWNSYDWPVYIPEGGSDTAALITLGLCAIGRSSALGSVTKLVELLSGSSKSVCVIGERDEKPDKRGEVHSSCKKTCKGCMLCWPGMAGARETAKRLTKELKQKVYWCLLPDAKDSRDWLNKNNGCNWFDFVKATKAGCRNG